MRNMQATSSWAMHTTSLGLLGRLALLRLLALLLLLLHGKQEEVAASRMRSAIVLGGTEFKTVGWVG